MRQSILFISAFLFITFSVTAQDNFLIGRWDFEKIPDNIEIDEQGRKMSEMMVGKMYVSFDENNYTHFLMGGSENGTWKFKEDNVIQLFVSKGFSYDAILEKIDDDHIIFNNMQMKRSDEEVKIIVEENRLDAIEGIDIDVSLLEGTWYYNGKIKDGETDDSILRHNENEIVNYTFHEDGKFVNRAVYEDEIVSNWRIDSDKQTVLIDGEDSTEYLRIVKLDKNKLHYYNPLIQSTVMFVK